MEIRGVVEGFYGKPYRWSDRHFILEYLANFGFNYYLYGPKQDPFHRKRWSTLYPKSEFLNFEIFNNKCSKLGITFNYAITPGDDIALAIEKLSPFKKMGINDFSIFFDDLDLKIGSELALTQARIVNSIFERLRPKRLLFCPTQYCGQKTPYLYHLAKNLNKNVFILWTGPKIVSKQILDEDITWLTHLFGQRIVLWDNYPVNDYDTSRIFLGPFRGRRASILNKLSGYLANPMQQAKISLIPLYTLSEFLKEKADYQPSKAIKQALKIFHLEKEISMLRQFYPSPLNPRKSYETQLLITRDFEKLLPIISRWQRFKFMDGQSAVDNLLLAGEVLIAKITGRTKNNKVKTIITSKRKEKDCYFENRVVDFLLT